MKLHQMAPALNSTTKSKRIGRDYYIPKICVIDFFTKN